MTIVSVMPNILPKIGHRKDRNAEKMTFFGNIYFYKFINFFT